MSASAAAHPKAAAAHPTEAQVLLYVVACFMIKQFYVKVFWIQEFLLEAATSQPAHPQPAAPREEVKVPCCSQFNVCKIKASRFVFSLPFSLSSGCLSSAGGTTCCSSSRDCQGAVLLQFFKQLFLSLCWRHQALQQLRRHPRCCVVAVLQSTLFVFLLEASSVAAAPKTSKVLCCCSSTNIFCLSARGIKCCSSSKDIQGAV